MRKVRNLPEKEKKWGSRVLHEPGERNVMGPQRSWGSDPRVDKPKVTRVLILQGVQRSYPVSHVDYAISLSYFFFF